MVKPGLLKKQILLKDLKNTDLAKIAKIAKELSFKKGEYLFREKEATKGLYLIQSGKIEISKLTTDGWRQTLAVLKARHFLGELSIIENRRHEASAIAIENSEIFLITKKDVENMEKKDAALFSRIMKQLVLITSRNLRRMNEKFLSSLISY